MFAIQFGTQTIEYDLILMPRKTLGITVHPNLSVTVKAPENTDLTQIEAKLKQRAAWILYKQRQFEIYLPDIPPRQYVSGESHRFLGRQYRLKVLNISSPQLLEAIILTRQFIEVHTADNTPAHVREVVTTWYHAQAQQIFQERLAACSPKFEREGISQPNIKIRRMQSSWGSCSAKGTISLNIKLVQVPKEYIDYVVTHELCHLKQLNHGADFTALLSRMMPDWQQRKDRLDRFDFG